MQKLIPRAQLFAQPHLKDPKLSPDGTQLAYLAPDANGVTQLWVRPTEAETGTMVTSGGNHGPHAHFWAYDQTHLIYVQDKDGDQLWRLFAVNFRSHETRALTPFEDIRVRQHMASPARPDTLLIVTMGDWGPNGVYELTISDGTLKFVTQREEAMLFGWVADMQLRVRAVLVLAEDGNDVLVCDRDDAPWRPVYHFGPEAGGHIVGFSEDGGSLYLVSSQNAPTKRLLALELASGRETVLAEDPAYDLDDDPWYHRRGVLRDAKGVPAAVSFYREKLEWRALDETWQADLERLQTGAHELGILSRSQDDTRWLVSLGADDQPLNYALYDRNSGRLESLQPAQPDLQRLTFAKKRPFTCRARDGLTLHGYLTLPLGVPAQNLPTVMLVHGGPNARDRWTFDAEVQWLANRGYAVVQVNYRGSSGYGRAFRSAAEHEWGHKTQYDVLDALAWAVAEGVTDPACVGVMGFSFGGYMALGAMALSPGVFAAGVSLCGFSSLLSFIGDIEQLSAGQKAWLEGHIGNPETELELLKARSPLYAAEHVTGPSLVVHGVHDPQSPIAESTQMVEALRQEDKDVHYLVFEDEGHGFERTENRLHYYATVEAFLAQHLGGEAEPAVPEQVTGHSGSFR